MKVPVEKLRAGMVTAQGVYNPLGITYLQKGVPLKESYIGRLTQMGIDAVAVTSINPEIRLLPPPDVVREKTRVSAIHSVANFFHGVQVHGTMDLDPLHDVSKAILNDLMQRENNLVQLTDIRLHDTYTFAHSVNVAILSGMLGTLLGMKEHELLELILGALLHDVGKVVVPAEILTKPGRLTDEEFDIIKSHPSAGWKKLREVFSITSFIPLVAAQHHEHMDGTGYPRRLRGSQIHPYARICAVADVYDALTSSRPYKKAYAPSVAYRIMRSCSIGQFDEACLKPFFDNVAIYPVGTVLKTRLGFAVVKKARFGHTLTPRVCVFADREGKVLSKPYMAELRDYPSDVVESVLNDGELFHFIHSFNIDPVVFLEEEI